MGRRRNDTEPPRSSSLRARAEKILAEKGFAGVIPADVTRLVRELQVHQIELEIQQEDLKRAQGDIAESREKYVDLYDLAPVAYFSFDRNGLITEVNLTAASLVGIERKRLIGKAFSLFVSPPSRDIFFAHRDKTQMTTQAERCELLIRRKDDSLVPVLMESMIASDKTGHVTIRSAVTDITERKRMEEELRNANDELEQRTTERTAEIERQARLTEQERDRLMTLLDSMTDGVWLADAGGKILLANRVAKEQASEVGLDPGTPYGPEMLSQVEVFTLDGRPLGMEKLLRVLQGDALRELEIGVRNKAGGDTFYRRLSVNRVTDREKRIAGAVVLVQDITPEKQAEEEKARLGEQLRQAQKMEAMGTLAGGIAHDFNNILAAIIGFANISIDKAPVGSQLHRNAERIFTAGIRGRELVKHILTFARQTAVEKRPLQLSPAIKEITSLLRSSIPTTVDLRFRVTTKSGTVLADPAQIQQVVMNLCTNAVHAMKEEGTITIELSDLSFQAVSEAPVSTMSPGSYVKLSISDTGHGIAPDMINRIFDPFFTTKKPGEGTGLGLSVVHGIVESHGGAIQVQSEPGKGSTFTIYLPKFVGDPRPHAEADEFGILGGRERILFIDDEEALTDMGEELLRDLGYEVTSKTNPREGLALLRLRPHVYDMVITDQTMPEITGLELAKEIIALRGDMPIILCTGFSHLVNEESARAAGIRGFVMKPLTKREIAMTIRKVLDERAR